MKASGVRQAQGRQARHAKPTHAMTVSLLAVIGIGVASALAMPLLPRKRPADTGH